MTGLESGNGGVAIVRFSLMSTRARLKRTTIAPPFPIPSRLCAFASNFQRAPYGVCERRAGSFHLYARSSRPSAMYSSRRL